MNTSVKQFRQYGNGTSVGYVTHLILFSLEQIVSLSPNGLEVSATGVQLVDGAKGALFEFTDKGCVWKESEVDDDAGQYYSINIDFSTYGQSKELMSWLYANQARRFVGFWRDANGICYVAGNVENGLRYQYQRNVTNRSMIQVGIGGKYTEPICFLEASFLASQLQINSIVNN